MSQNVELGLVDRAIKERPGFFAASIQRPRMRDPHHGGLGRWLMQIRYSPSAPFAVSLVITRRWPKKNGD